MHPEVGRTVYAIILTLIVLDVISLIFLTPSEVSFYVALVALFFLAIVLVWTIRDIRRQAGQWGLGEGSFE